MIVDSTIGTNEVKMQVGDLVKRKNPEQFFIYSGAGMWEGWGEFIDLEGRTIQIQMLSVELICK